MFKLSFYYLTRLSTNPNQVIFIDSVNLMCEKMLNKSACVLSSLNSFGLYIFSSDEEKGKKMWAKYLEREDSKIVGE